MGGVYSVDSDVVFGCAATLEGMPGRSRFLPGLPAGEVVSSSNIVAAFGGVFEAAGLDEKARLDDVRLMGGEVRRGVVGVVGWDVEQARAGSGRMRAR